LKGRLLEEVEVPAYGGRALEVAAGRFVRIVNLEGEQVGDAFALSTDDPREFLSAGQTRAFTRRLFPAVGQRFYTNRQRPVLTFEADHSPGVHDMLWVCCDPAMYRNAGVAGAHPNCRDNFLDAVAAAGLRSAVVPEPVNLFQDTPLGPDGSLRSRRSPAKRGDHVLFKVEMRALFVLTACSWDVGVGDQRINGDRCTGLRIEVYG